MFKRARNRRPYDVTLTQPISESLRRPEPEVMFTPVVTTFTDDSTQSPRSPLIQGNRLPLKYTRRHIK